MQRKSNPQTDRLAQLEAERLVLTVELRNQLIREAKKLLPAALRQARHKTRPSPALLRLIARLAMRATDVDRRHARR